MRSTKLQNISAKWLLSTLLLMLMLNDVKGQIITYPTSDDVNTEGVCLFCSVTNRALAYDTDINTKSTLNLTVGVAGSIYQTLIFSSLNNNQGCDEVVIVFGSSASLITANILGGITIQALNGSTPVDGPIKITVSTLTLLNGGSMGQVKIRPTLKFDRVKITLSGGLIGALNNINIHTVYKLNGQPSLAAIPASTICSGNSTDLSTLNPIDNNGVSGGTYTWSLTQGGTALSSTIVSPTTTTTYWVRYSKNGCYSDQSALINVKPVPSLTSLLNKIVCSGSLFTYTASSSLGSTSFSWIRNPVAGITNPAGSGTTNLINETLINSTQLPINVTYTFTLTASGCTTTNANVTVKVYPKPGTAHIILQ